MIVLSNTTAQTLAVGESITLDRIISHTGCGECASFLPTAARLKNAGIYEVNFSGNIGATAPGIAELSVQIDGFAIPYSAMITTTAAAGDLNNVSVSVPVKNCACDHGRVVITNTGATEITVGANSLLYIKRVS